MTTAIAAGIAAALGFASALMPAPYQITLAVVLILLLGVLVTRSRIRAADLKGSGVASILEEPTAAIDAYYRSARWLTLVGFLTIAFLAIRPTTTLTLSDWVFLAALVIATLGTMASSRVPRLAARRYMVIGGALFVVGALVSLPNTADQGQSIAVVARFLYVTIGWFALASFSLRTVRDVAAATQLWVASVALSGIAAIAQLLGSDAIAGLAGGTGRMVGLAQHVTDLGGMAAIALVPAVWLLDSPRHSPSRRLLSAAILALVAAGLLLSGSVDGFIAAGVGLTIWIGTGNAGRRGLLALLGLAASFAVFATALAQMGLALPGARIAAVVASPIDPNATLYLRLQTFDQAWQWIGNSPLVGVGFDPTGGAGITNGLVHNILIATWLQGGIIALVGIALVLLAAAAEPWRAWIAPLSPESRRLAAALLAAFGAAVAFSMANAILFQRYVWAPVFLSISLVTLRSHHAASTMTGRVGRSGSVDFAAPAPSFGD